MQKVQVHPIVFVDPKDVSHPVKFLAAELLRGEGGLSLRNYANLLHGVRAFDACHVNDSLFENGCKDFTATESSATCFDKVVGLVSGKLHPVDWIIGGETILSRQQCLLGWSCWMRLPPVSMIAYWC